MLKPRKNPKLDTVVDVFTRARSMNIMFQNLEGPVIDGKFELNGTTVVNFGSCSYLGLECDERVKKAASDAVMKHGVQFSSSRAYASNALYREFENELATIVETDAIVLAPTTTLAHASTLPVLVGEKDAVLFDPQVHATVQICLPEMLVRGVHVEMTKHDDLDDVEKRAITLSSKYDRVFYLADGVYSMHGNVLNGGNLINVLERNPQLVAYVDDSHGTSWCGTNGSGTVLGRGLRHDRLIVVLGLSKSFASSGGLVVFPNLELADQIRMCGPTMIFSGPLQPAQLGAGIASAKIHLSSELNDLQEKLRSNVKRFVEGSAERGIDVIPSDSPVRFAKIGPTDKVMQLTRDLMKNGYYVNASAYPAVPRNEAGLRIMLNVKQSFDQIDGLLDKTSELLA